MGLGGCGWGGGGGGGDVLQSRTSAGRDSVRNYRTSDWFESTSRTEIFGENNFRSHTTSVFVPVSVRIGLGIFPANT